nr:ChbG/HpnK family deacetylase [Faecalibaculum rodentium]
MKLIINGDDFGITPACNETIIDCYRKGRLTSAR